MLKNYNGIGLVPRTCIRDAAMARKFTRLDRFHKRSAYSLHHHCRRSKSFPAQSNYYKALRNSILYFEQLTDGTPCAYNKIDEVARNGAFQEGLRPEVFLGAPCIFASRRTGNSPPHSLIAIPARPVPNVLSRPLQPDAIARPRRPPSGVKRHIPPVPFAPGR